MPWRVETGDMLETLPTIADNSIHACITDPPYGLKFMNREWDHGVPGKPFWQEVLRVLKPGGMLLAFGGTRTHHRLMCAIEDAGFELRDCLMWLYGCLSDDTEILVDGKWEPYHKAAQSHLTLCYDAEHDEFSWKPIQDLYMYDYDDTAYRIESDHTDQIVSRNHRCLVERDGAYVFEAAEEVARKRKAGVPVLEDLSGLLDDLPVPYEGASSSQQDLFQGVRGREFEGASTRDENSAAERDVRGMWEDIPSRPVTYRSDQSPDVFQAVQRVASRGGVEEACSQGSGGVDRGIGKSLGNAHDGGHESSLEGRRDLLSEARKLQVDQVREVPTGIFGNGTKRRLCDGAQIDCGPSPGKSVETHGGGTPQQSRPTGQSPEKSVVVFQQQRPQAVRGSRYTRTDLAGITPVHYRGVVWCVRVPTGAFVARRNGKIFVTGNSGFPKSLDISKAIDKAAGAEREVVGSKEGLPGYSMAPDKGRGSMNAANDGSLSSPDRECSITAPSTDEAQLWEGWGTALKPAHEPIILAMKPVMTTFAANALEHGVAGLNIDGCRVGVGQPVRGGGNRKAHNNAGYGAGKTRGCRPLVQPHNRGRWPANVVLDEEVAAMLDEQSGELGSGSFSGHRSAPKTKNTFGKFEIRDEKPSGFGDSGGASRFFKCCNFDPDELLLCRAKTILRAWNPNLASIAESSSSLQSQSVVFALRDAVILASHGARQLSDYRAPTTPVTVSELENLFESVIAMTLNLELGLSPESREIEPIQFHGLASSVVPHEPTGTMTTTANLSKSVGSVVVAMSDTMPPNTEVGEKVSRFRYCSKASRRERTCGGEIENRHPTVKPLSLMRWLCRLVKMPESTIILDPFCGSGTTGMAAVMEGASFIGVEKDPDHAELARERIRSAWSGQKP